VSSQERFKMQQPASFGIEKLRTLRGMEGKFHGLEQHGIIVSTVYMCVHCLRLVS